MGRKYATNQMWVLLILYPRRVFLRSCFYPRRLDSLSTLSCKPLDYKCINPCIILLIQNPILPGIQVASFIPRRITKKKKKTRNTTFYHLLSNSHGTDPEHPRHRCRRVRPSSPTLPNQISTTATGTAPKYNRVSVATSDKHTIIQR